MLIDELREQLKSMEPDIFMLRIVLIRHDSDPEDDRIVTFLRNKGIEPLISEPQTCAMNYRDSGSGCVASSTSRSSVPG